MLMFLLSLAWGWRMVMLQLSGFYCRILVQDFLLAMLHGLLPRPTRTSTRNARRDVRVRHFFCVLYGPSPCLASFWCDGSGVSSGQRPSQRKPDKPARNRSRTLNKAGGRAS